MDPGHQCIAAKKLIRAGFGKLLAAATPSACRLPQQLAGPYTNSKKIQHFQVRIPQAQENLDESCSSGYRVQQPSTMSKLGIDEISFQQP